MTAGEPQLEGTATRPARPCLPSALYNLTSRVTLWRARKDVSCSSR